MKTICHNFYRKIIFNASALSLNEKLKRWMKIKTCTFKGKSRLCSYYIHCKSFDGDLLALNLRKEHPDICS